MSSSFKFFVLSRLTVFTGDFLPKNFITKNTIKPNTIIASTGLTSHKITNSLIKRYIKSNKLPSLLSLLEDDEELLSYDESKPESAFKLHGFIMHTTKKIKTIIHKKIPIFLYFFSFPLLTP